MELSFDKWPHAKFYDNDKEDYSETKITNIIINKEENVRDWTNNNRVDETEHSGFIIPYFP